MTTPSAMVNETCATMIHACVCMLLFIPYTKHVSNKIHNQFRYHFHTLHCCPQPGRSCIRALVVGMNDFCQCILLLHVHSSDACVGDVVTPANAMQHDKPRAPPVLGDVD